MIGNLETNVPAPEAKASASASRTVALDARCGKGVVWIDKHGENARLTLDLEAARAEIIRRGGVVPQPLGPVRVRTEASIATISVSRPRFPTEGSPGQPHFPTSTTD